MGSRSCSRTTSASPTSPRACATSWRIRPPTGNPCADNIHEFLLYSKEHLRDFQVPVAADVFGLVMHLDDDIGIGQNWERVVTAADVLLPMVYPSHYIGGHYGFARPHEHPYEIVRMASTEAVERTAWMRDSAKAMVAETMPWLEAMSIRGVHFGAEEVRLQIQAVYDAGLKSWSLWNPGSRFQRVRRCVAAGGRGAVGRGTSLDAAGVHGAAAGAEPADRAPGTGVPARPPTRAGLPS